MPVNITPQVNETTSPFQFDGAVTVAGGSLSSVMSAYSPAQAGLQAWTFPSYLAFTAAAAAPGQGQQLLGMTNLTSGSVLSNIILRVATAANGLTSGQCFAGLYNSAGTLVASTAQLASVVGTNTGFITCPLTTPYNVTTAGPYWVGTYFNGGTNPVLTVPSGATAITTAATSAAGLASAASFPFAVNGSGLTTALPATITPSSNSLTSAFVFWAGVS